MTTEHTLQQLKEIAEAGGELLGFIVVNGEGHGGYAWGYSRRAAEDELMAVKVAENPAHGPFAIVAAHTPTISKVDALDLIAQVEKLEAALQAMLDTHRVDDGVSHATEGWMRARGMAVVALRDHRDEPATDGTAKEGAGQ